MLFRYLRENNKKKSKVFKNTKEDFIKITDWLKLNANARPEEIIVTVEPTGVYHESLTYHLYHEGFQIALINTGKARKYAESKNIVHKTDKMDAYVLADYGRALKGSNELPMWEPEPEEVRHIKLLMRRLDALEQDSQREKNRLEAYNYADSSSVVIESVKGMIDILETEIKRLSKDIDDRISGNPELKKNRELLCSIDGVGEVISREMTYLLASKHFTSAKQVSAYLGLIPRMKESGTLRGRVSLSKTGPSKTRAKLFMAAVVASTYNPDIRAQKERLLKHGKNKMQALGAAMRKLVQICFGVVKHQQVYQPQVS